MGGMYQVLVCVYWGMFVQLVYWMQVVLCYICIDFVGLFGNVDVYWVGGKWQQCGQFVVGDCVQVVWGDVEYGIVVVVQCVCVVLQQFSEVVYIVD